jgi:hypothetical protein
MGAFSFIKFGKFWVHTSVVQFFYFKNIFNLDFDNFLKIGGSLSVSLNLFFLF